MLKLESFSRKKKAENVLGLIRVQAELICTTGGHPSAEGDGGAGGKGEAWSARVITLVTF